MTASKSVTVYWRGNQFRIFQRIISPVNVRQILQAKCCHLKLFFSCRVSTQNLSFCVQKQCLHQWFPTFFMPWPTCHFLQNVVAHHHITIEKSTLCLHCTNISKLNTGF